MGSRYALERLEDIFQHQVSQNPCSKALHYQSAFDCWQTVTYQQLNSIVDTTVRRILNTPSVEQSSFIGICVSPGPYQISSILATLKSGHAYVPIDPKCPAARLSFILKDICPRNVLVDSKTMSYIVDSIPQDLLASLYFIFVDRNEQIPAQEDQLTDEKPQLLSPLAYMIYTSGSTGSPHLFGLKASQTNIVSNERFSKRRPDISPGNLGLFTTYPSGVTNEQVRPLASILILHVRYELD